MKRRILFILTLLIGILAITATFYFFGQVDKIAQYVALYTSVLTATYAILEKNPNKTEKQQIYGQLKGIFKNIITILEKRTYENITFELWESVQQDYRYEMVNRKFPRRLDGFLERTKKYSSAVNALDHYILPTIIVLEQKRFLEKNHVVRGIPNMPT